MFFRLNLFVAVLVFTTALSGLTTTSAQTNSQRDAVIGGVAGAIIGGIAGKQNDETPEGIAIGGVAGAIAGHVLGKAKDRNIQDQYYYQQQATRQYQQQQAVAMQKAVSIQDAISMSSNGVSPQLIINQIQSSGVQQEIGVSEIIALHQNGVSELVINEMQRASVGGPSTVRTRQPAVFVEPAPVVVARPSIEFSRPTVIVEHGNHWDIHSSHRGYNSSHYQQRPPHRSANGRSYHMHR